MSQFNRNPYPTNMMNEQQFNQINYTFNSYCKVMRVPKLGAAPVVITVLEGLVLTGRYYLFIKNGAVLRRDSITDVVSIPTHTCIGLNATVNDENGKMSFLICRLHGLSARANISEICNIVLQR